MKKKQTLAVLLAAAMVLSMPVGVYAEELDEWKILLVWWSRILQTKRHQFYTIFKLIKHQ